MGVTVGFHRLLTHRSFQTYKPVQYALAIVGSMAVEGPVMNWVADHRKHHAHTDPRATRIRRTGTAPASRAPWSASGTPTWAGCSTTPARASTSATRATSTRTAGCSASTRRSVCGSRCRSRSRALLGLAFTGTWRGAFEAALWGGAVRIFLVHHVTWSINSVCHFFGSRRASQVDDHSTNVAWLSLLSMGESWHHNHHTFPRSAFHGLRSLGALDPTAWVIRGMRRVKLAWNVVEITPERQREKLA